MRTRVKRRWRRFERPVGGSWRVDKTFIKVRGQWMYLYRSVDGQGNTVEFFLSRTRGIAAANGLLSQGTELRRMREPHSIPTWIATGRAIARYGAHGNERGVHTSDRGGTRVKIRCCPCLPEQRCGAGPPPGEGPIAPDVSGSRRSTMRDESSSASNWRRRSAHKRQFAIPTTWQSNPAVIPASRHGSIGRIAAAHS